VVFFTRQSKQHGPSAVAHRRPEVSERPDGGFFFLVRHNQFQPTPLDRSRSTVIAGGDHSVRLLIHLLRRTLPRGVVDCFSPFMRMG
jgi:hypothetical protein